MVSSISSASSYLIQMMTQTMQQRQDNLFSKVDSNKDGGLDKTEFSDLAKKMSEMSGSSISADNMFATYDANNDGTLSKDDFLKFMKDNAPAPPDGMSSIMGQMNTQGMQQGFDKLFGKIDSNGDNGIDKSEFASFASKMAKHTGNSVNADNIFSAYDANNDGKLSNDEFSKFMKDNAPSPPAQMQNASSAYGANSSDLLSQLIEMLKKNATTDSTGSSSEANSKNDYVSKLLDALKSKSNGNDTNSTVNLTLINITA